MNNKTRGNFFLDKTYLDCIDNAGNCFILYSARIKFLFFKFHYSAFIFSDEHDHVTEGSSFHKGTMDSSGGSLVFSNKRFKICGVWEMAEKPVESLLYGNSNGVVNWNCHHPLAYCNIDHNHHSFGGLGYAETLFLSIKPWQLPIDELRWGRFLAPGVAITWIQWLGKNPINKIYLNGKEMNDARHSADTITFNKGKNKLAFSNISIIRQVKFADHLSGIPLLKLFINKGILNSLESKYKSRTIFTGDSGKVHHGWSIFEIIQWEH